MTKSKSGSLARLPKEQRCQFLIGPVSSWFMSNTTDIWTQPGIKSPNMHNQGNNSEQDNEIVSANTRGEEHPTLSYFAYGSIGCFCYGEVYHSHKNNQTPNFDPNLIDQSAQVKNQISAIVNRLVDVKEDNSRVFCIRFLKECTYPMLMVLTENGSLIIHDCLSNDSLVQYKKAEVLFQIIGLKNNEDEKSNDQNGAKRARYNVTQQINSCCWPNAQNAFIAITLLKEKTCLLVWLKLKNIINSRSNLQPGNKFDIVEGCQRLELDLPQYCSPVCVMESAMLDSQVCLIALAMDDGLIIVVSVNLTTGKTNRTIQLVRHNDQICSMSLYIGNKKKFPSGLLASVSRNGLVLIWDIENEFYFADYQAIAENGTAKINWFAVSFVSSLDEKRVHLAVSNSESRITILDLPENARSKIRLKDNRDKQKKQASEQGPRHNALIFNMRYDQYTRTIVTSSLDGNHIFWNFESQDVTNNATKNSIQSLSVKSQFLYPAMLNNSRTHMLRHSPIRDDLMGLALGKAGVRFYRIPESTTDCRFDMSPSCALVARKLNKTNLSPTSLAWHPSHEYRLAIGTLEGKVFLADITPRKANLVETNHKTVIKTRVQSEKVAVEISGGNMFDDDYKPPEKRPTDEASKDGNCLKTDGIYSLTWGPSPASPQDMSKHAIYAIGSVSHRLFIYNSNKDNSDKLTNYLDDFLDQSLPEAIGEASEVAWKSSLDLMALGTTNGRIIIVTYLDESHGDRSKSRLFDRLAVIQGPLGHTHIQCLDWHPTTNKDDAQYYYLAASANESPAFIFNLRETVLVNDVEMRLRIARAAGDTEQQNNDDEHALNNATTSMLSAYIHKLDAHKKAITDISWSPYEKNLLATASFDRLAYVWSIEDSFMDARAMAQFSARDRLFTLEWSLVDADLLYTSGHDSTIWAWRPSENRVKTVQSVGGGGGGGF